MDFDFATAPPGGGSAGQPAAAAVPAGQLPPDIVVDRYLLQAERAVRDRDPAAARAAMERLDALQREHGLNPAAEEHFRYAQAWEAAGEPERAMESAVRYLQLRGREAERYAEALELMNRAESGVPAPASNGAAQSAEAGQPLRPGPQPACAGQSEGAACWRELASHPGCHVWVASYSPDVTDGTWTGGCSGGLASGTGTLRWVRNGEAHEYSGLLQNGRLQGLAIERNANGDVGEGPYVDGKRNGRWIIRFADGQVEEGPLLDDKRSGYWVVRHADGDLSEGPFVDGKQHGDWILRRPDGTTEHSTYVNGEQQ